jgi:excisionase family DNA binding protein
MSAATLYPVPAFRIAEAAALLGVSDDTVRRWVDSGRLPFERDQSRRMVIDAQPATTSSGWSPPSSPTP